MFHIVQDMPGLDLSASNQAAQLAAAKFAAADNEKKLISSSPSNNPYCKINNLSQQSVHYQHNNLSSYGLGINNNSSYSTNNNNNNNTSIYLNPNSDRTNKTIPSPHLSANTVLEDQLHDTIPKSRQSIQNKRKTSMNKWNDINKASSSTALAAAASIVKTKPNSVRSNISGPIYIKKPPVSASTSPKMKHTFEYISQPTNSFFDKDNSKLSFNDNEFNKDKDLDKFNYNNIYSSIPPYEITSKPSLLRSSSGTSYYSVSSSPKMNDKAPKFGSSDLVQEDKNKRKPPPPPRAQTAGIPSDINLESDNDILISALPPNRSLNSSLYDQSQSRKTNNLSKTQKLANFFTVKQHPQPQSDSNLVPIPIHQTNNKDIDNRSFDPQSYSQSTSILPNHMNNLSINESIQENIPTILPLNCDNSYEDSFNRAPLLPPRSPPRSPPKSPPKTSSQQTSIPQLQSVKLQHSPSQNQSSSFNQFQNGIPPQKQQQQSSHLVFISTLRNDDKKSKGGFGRNKKKTFNENKPWKSHDKESLNQITPDERKRYEGIFAANKGVYIDLDDRLTDNYEEHAKNITDIDNLDEFVNTYSNPKDRIHGIIVHEIWNRSKLDNETLKKIWELSLDDRKRKWLKELFDGKILINDDSIINETPNDNKVDDLINKNNNDNTNVNNQKELSQSKYLSIDRSLFDDCTLTLNEFIVGTWLIDQCLYGRKMPKEIPTSVWNTVGVDWRLPDNINIKYNDNINNSNNSNNNGLNNVNNNNNNNSNINNNSHNHNHNHHQHNISIHTNDFDTNNLHFTSNHNYQNSGDFSKKMGKKDKLKKVIGM